MEKKQRRATIIHEEENHEEDFLEFLENKTNVSHLIVNVELNGDLDLGVLSGRGVVRIEFAPGDITSIRNIPEGIEIFQCSNNLLIDLPDLPTSLIELHVTNNIIRSLDVSKLSSLEVLRIDQNEFREISGLPETLRELYCRSNGLISLDLKSAENLCTLHCDENPDLILYDVPESVYDSKYPETVTHAKKNTKMLTEKMIQNIRNYYEMKNKYDSQLQKLRKDHSNKLPLCKKCEKPVGMIFSRRQDGDAMKKFSVTCGGTPSCGFQFEFTKEKQILIEEQITHYLSEVEEEKEKMIMHKMSSLFHHMGDKIALEGFEKRMENYELSEWILNSYFEDKEKLHDIQSKMIPKQKKIQDKIKLVKEALDAGDIKRVAEIQYMEIFPLSQFIQRQLYEVMEMKTTYNNDAEIIYSKLYQEEVSIRHSETTV